MGNTVNYTGYEVSDQEPWIEKLCIDLRGRCILTILFWMPVHFFWLECFRKSLTVPCTLELALLTSWTADGRWAGKYILYLLWQPEICCTSTLNPSRNLNSLLLLISTLVLFPNLSIGISCGSSPSPWGLPTKLLCEYVIPPSVLRCTSSSSCSFLMFSPCCFLLSRMPIFLFGSTLNLCSTVMDKGRISHPCIQWIKL